MTKRPAIFLDRDDTLLIDAGYMSALAAFQWCDRAPQALVRFHKAGLPIFIITNQGGIARGFFTEAAMHQFHAHLKMQARLAGAEITDIAYCPHHPLSVIEALRTPCTCRKPEPGMIIALANKHAIDLKQSVVIGDRRTDIEAGQRAGCHSLLVTPQRTLYDLAGDAIALTRGELTP